MLQFPDIESLLGDFESDLLPSCPTDQRRKNIRQRAKHVEVFLRFMGHDTSGTGAVQPPAHLSYISDRTRLTAWFQRLYKAWTPTTVSNYIQDVRRFIDYLKDRKPAGILVTFDNLDRLVRWLRLEREALGDHITAHRFKIMEQKSERMLTSSELNQHRTLAHNGIPQALSRIEDDPSSCAAVRDCVGLMASYFVSVSGLRRACFVNMTEADLNSAMPAGEDSKVVRLDHGKTRQTYGAARLNLTQEEYSWLLRFQAQRRHMTGFSADVRTMFFTSTGRAMEKMGCHVKRAYVRSINRSGVTITAIRSAVTTVADRALSLEQQATVSRSMGHSMITKNKYYAAHSTPDEVRETRLMLDRVITGSSPPALQTLTPAVPRRKPGRPRKAKPSA